jgi:hypothetical protein
MDFLMDWSFDTTHELSQISQTNLGSYNFVPNKLTADLIKP